MRKIILIAVMAIASVAISQTSTGSKDEINNKKSTANYNCAGCGDNAIESNQTINLQKKISDNYENNLPYDFPKYIDTGNQKQDLANFHDAKQEWIRKNPERFEKIKTLNLNQSIPKNK